MAGQRPTPKRSTKAKSRTRPNRRTYRRSGWRGRLNQWRSQFLSLKKWQRVGIYIIVAVLVLSLLQSAVDRAFPRVANPNFGVSFSTKYAEELGLDWQETYLALLDDMGLRSYRLMSYWDEGEPGRGVYDLGDLDWQMNEAAKRGAQVSLAIGLRQPRWPECHRPAWYPDLSKEQQDQALFEYLTVVVNRYKDHPALISYQLENEAVNTWFGTCTDKDIDRQRLNEEFKLVKSLDPDTPVWMSLSDQHGLPLGEPVPDKYGYSVYRTVYNDKTAPLKFYITYPTPIWYHRLRAWWITTFKDRDIFIHELQLEPWAPVATVNATIKEQNKSMDLEQMAVNVDFASRIGKEDIYTWGGEWWYWRKTVHDDPGPWDKARQLLIDQN